MSDPLPPFSQPHVLRSLGTGRLSKLLSGFTADLCAAGLMLPCENSGDYFTDLASLFSARSTLPASLRDVLCLIEQVAVPENNEWVRSQAARLNPYGPSSSSLLEDALNIWFLAPKLLLEFAGHPAEPQPSPVPSVPGLPAFRREDPAPAPPDPETLHAPAGPAAPGAGLPLQEREHPPLAQSLPPSPRFPLTAATPPRFRIARLPEETRNSINLMLQDHLSYDAILQNLGELGKTLNKSSLSRWKKTGYQDWLKAQQKQQEVHNRFKVLVDTLRENQTSKVHEASQQMATIQIFELLNTLDPAPLKEALQADAAGYVRLLTVLPRLSDGGLACERHRAKLERKKSPPSRGISEESLREAERKLKLL